MIKFIAKYDGGRGNGDGEMWMHFEAAYTELPNVMPYVSLVDTKLHIAIDMEGEKRQYLGWLMSNGYVRAPKGDSKITLRGKHNTINHAIIDKLTDKTFTVMFLTDQEMAQLLNDASQDGIEQDQNDDGTDEDIEL